jgi:hypothetical protein
MWVNPNTGVAHVNRQQKVYPTRHRLADFRLRHGTALMGVLYSYGNPNPGTAVILWSQRHDANQI